MLLNAKPHQRITSVATKKLLLKEGKFKGENGKQIEMEKKLVYSNELSELIKG